MPKRINDFQNLIKFIYDRITPKGGKVTESAMVYDKDAKILREVDILIEQKISGHLIKIAVECRDRSRKDTVEWIDGLIGKSSSLDVNKVVAVSKKGFAKTASIKAKSHGIDTLSMEKATKKEWESHFIKPGLALCSQEWFTLGNVIYLCKGAYRNLSDLGMDSSVESNGKKLGTIKEAFEKIFYESIIPEAQAYINKHRMEIFKTYSDYKKTLYIEKDITFDEPLIIGGKGSSTVISQVKYLVQGTRQIFDVKKLKHSMFNQKMISTGEHDNNNNSKLKFKILQDPETGTLHTNWTKESSK